MQALGERLQPLAREAARRLVDDLGGLPRTPEKYGFIHGDPHQWDLLFVRDGAGAIDFSDCGWGHRAMDLASPLQFLRWPLAGNHDHRAHYPALRDALLQGYADVAPLPRDIERQVAIYIAARFLMSLDWILDDWPRPDFRPWGPAFVAGCEDVFRDYVAT